MSDADTHFEALTIVSPARFTGEDKNQDRARWFPERLVAGVCDGPTNSPRCDEAAELITSIVPMLFTGDMPERLAGACDLLVARRQAARKAAVVLPPETMPAMKDLLTDLAHERMSAAFQTTLIALSVTVTSQDLIAQIVRCGDSALFAFSETGELLSSSPAVEQPRDETNTLATNGLRYGPGCELLVKVLGRASDHALQADLHAVDLKAPSRWLVCAPLDVACQSTTHLNKGRELPTHTLTSSDLLLVPQYLVGHTANKPYQHIPFSSSVRLAAHKPSTDALCFNGKSNVTHVLPDHFFRGQWVYRQEHFPLDTNFILASDGFYEAFQSAQDLWEWLRRAKIDLRKPNTREARLQSLHQRLSEHTGDDDISFVWLFPRKTTENQVKQGTQTKASRRHQ